MFTGYCKFHHNSTYTFFETVDGNTINIPPGESVIMSYENAEFMLKQIKNGGGSYSDTDETNVQVFEMNEKVPEVPETAPVEQEAVPQEEPIIESEE